MKQDKHKLTYRKFLKAEKRLNEIYKLLRQAPKVKLREPYQSGWTLSIVLRDDFARSERGILLSTILKDITVLGYIKNPKHITAIRKNPTLDNTYKILGEKGHYNAPYIHLISDKNYHILDIKLKNFFILDTLEMHKYPYRGNLYYLDIPRHYLMVKVNKRMITHAKELDTLLLQEQAELKKILEPYWRTCGGYSYRYDDWWINGKLRKYKKSNIEKLLELE